MKTKKECALNFAFGEGFKLAKITTRGAGLSMSQQFEALKSGGFDKKFVNECLVRTAFKKGVEGFELLSTDFKHKAFVSKDKVSELVILASDLKGLQKMSGEKVA